MANPGFLFLFFILGLVYFVVGVRASKKVKSETDYFVADRGLGVLQISCNLIATQLGGGLLLGTAASAYISGLTSLYYPLGIFVGFILLGLGIAEKIQQFRAVTTAQLFEIYFKSKTLKQVASILSIATLFGILIAQVICLKNLIASLGYSDWIGIVFWIVVTLYTVVGGLRAITVNDLIQLAVISVTFFGILFFNLVQSPETITQIFQAYEDRLFLPITLDLKSIASIILVPALFCLIEQDMAQRFFASKTKSVAKRSALIAGVYLILFSFIPAFLGMLTQINGLAVPEGASPLVIFLQSYMPTWVYTVAVCTVFTAIISTSDSLINGISANITQDFEWNFPQGRKIYSKFPKIVSFAVGLLALFASYYTPQNVVDVIITSYELSVSGLLVALLHVYYKKKPNQTSAVLSVIFGIGTFFILVVFSVLSFRVLISLAMSMIGYQLGKRGKTLPYFVS